MCSHTKTERVIVTMEQKRKSGAPTPAVGPQPAMEHQKANKMPPAIAVAGAVQWVINMLLGGVGRKRR